MGYKDSAQQERGTRQRAHTLFDMCSTLTYTHTETAAAPAGRGWWEQSCCVEGQQEAGSIVVWRSPGRLAVVVGGARQGGGR